MTRLFAGTPFDRPPRCESCGLPEEECRCPPAPAPVAARIPPELQTARLAVEKRKRGKFVSVIRGLAPEGNDLAALLTQLKTRCGAGGSLQDGQIEIQGKHLDRLRDELRAMGFKVQG